MISTNHYIFVSSTHMGNSVSTNHIIAKDKVDAISKVYAHYGGSYISTDEFRLICDNSEDYRIYNLFHNLTGENILYFAIIPDDCYVDNLNLLE